MQHIHYSAFTLDRFLSEDGDRAVAEIDHWASRCTTCRRAVQDLAHWLEVLGHFRPSVGPEYITRHEMFGELTGSGEPFDRQLAKLAYDDIYHHWGLTTLLIETSREARPRNPERAFELARLAQAAAIRLDEDYYQPEWVADLQALAHGELGDSLRALGRHAPAEREHQTARRLLEAGTGSRRVPHRLDQLEARLLRDQERYREAILLLERALSEQRAAAAELPLPWIFYRWRLERGGASEISR